MGMLVETWCGEFWRLGGVTNISCSEHPFALCTELYGDTGQESR